MEIALVSPYPPRTCGIATFGAHLRQGLLEAGDTRVQVVPIAAGDIPQPAGPEVLTQIRQHRREDYARAAAILNQTSVQAVIVQHEYGIFGGQDGSYIIDLVTALDMPVLVTLHTVLSSPSTGQRDVLRALSDKAQAVILAERARTLLDTIYGIDPGRVCHIPHGVPEFSAAAANAAPDAWRLQLDLDERLVALTFGLLGPGKGIELALDAVSHVAPLHPELLYVVAGATHPGELRAHGNAYRESLMARVKSMRIQDHVRFIDRFLEEQELFGLLAASDLYITPYPGKDQISSGTLTYAAYMGKAILSTPYVYAEELLRAGAGQLFPFHDATALASGLDALITDPVRRRALGAAAARRTRGFAWGRIGQIYRNLIAEAGIPVVGSARL